MEWQPLMRAGKTFHLAEKEQVYKASRELTRIASIRTEQVPVKESLQVPKHKAKPTNAIVWDTGSRGTLWSSNLPEWLYLNLIKMYPRITQQGKNKTEAVKQETSGPSTAQRGEGFLFMGSDYFQPFYSLKPFMGFLGAH